MSRLSCLFERDAGAARTVAAKAVRTATVVFLMVAGRQESAMLEVTDLER